MGPGKDLLHITDPFGPILYCVHLTQYSLLVSLKNTLPLENREAQRVARPAYANATVHFLLTYRLAMLLPPDE